MTVERTNPFAGMDFSQLADSFGAQGGASSSGANGAAPVGGAVDSDVAGTAGTALQTTASTGTLAGGSGSPSSQGDWQVSMNHQDMSFNSQGAQFNESTGSLNSRGEANLSQSRFEFGNGLAPAPAPAQVAGPQTTAPVAGTAPNGQTGGMSDMMQQFGQKMRDTIMGSFGSMMDKFFGKFGGNATPTTGTAAGTSTPSTATTPADSGAPVADTSMPAAGGETASSYAPTEAGSETPTTGGDMASPAGEEAYAAAEQSAPAAEDYAAAEQQAPTAQDYASGGEGRCGGHHGDYQDRGDTGGAAPEEAPQYDAEYSSDEISGDWASEEGSPTAAAETPASAPSDAEPQYDGEYSMDEFSGEWTPGGPMPWDTPEAQGEAPAIGADTSTSQLANAGSTDSNSFQNWWNQWSGGASSATDVATASDNKPKPVAPGKTGSNNMSFDHDEFQMSADGMRMTRWSADYNRGGVAAVDTTAPSNTASTPTSQSAAARDRFNLRREEFILKPRVAATTAVDAAVPATPALPAASAAPAPATSNTLNSDFITKFFPAASKPVK
jgi:hypothetical protein